MPTSSDSSFSCLHGVVPGSKYRNRADDELYWRERVREIAREGPHLDGDGEVQSGLQSLSPRAPVQRIKEQIAFYGIHVGKEAGYLSENRRNRFIHYARTRVAIGSEGRRYLNANWVRELHGGHWWIATQAPLPNTLHAFMSLFMQSDVHPPAYSHSSGSCRPRTVVQLTVATGDDPEQAFPYIPSKKNESTYLNAPNGCTDHIKITLKDTDEVSKANCTRSILRIVPAYAEGEGASGKKHMKEVKGGETVFITHLLFTGWQDFDVPENKEALLAFARLTADINRNTPPNSSSHAKFHPDPPIVVHCLAGIGRTGAFIAASSLLRKHGLLFPGDNQVSPEALPPLPTPPQEPMPNEFRNDKVVLEIDSLREQRGGMVQGYYQFKLVYEILAIASPGVPRPITPSSRTPTGGSGTSRHTETPASKTKGHTPH